VENLEPHVKWCWVLACIVAYVVVSSICQYKIDRANDSHVETVKTHAHGVCGPKACLPPPTR